MSRQGRGGRTWTPPELSPRDIACLQEAARGEGTDARRAQVILRSIRGETGREIAEGLGIHPSTVRLIRAELVRSGLGGTLPRPPRPTEEPESAEAVVARILRAIGEELGRLHGRGAPPDVPLSGPASVRPRIPDAAEVTRVWYRGRPDGGTTVYVEAGGHQAAFDAARPVTREECRDMRGRPFGVVRQDLGGDFRITHRTR